MKVLLTGGSGHLGHHVATELEHAGHEVVLFDRRAPHDDLRHLRWIEGDVSEWEDCRRAVRGGFDAVQHLAGIPYPTDHPQVRAMAEKQGLPFDATMRINLLGTYYLLQAALAEQIAIFVMTTSNCALGHNFRISGRPFPFRYLPVDEAHPTDGEDTYSFVKLANEELMAGYTRAYGMRTYAVRATAIVSLEQRKQMAAHAAPARGWSEGLWGWVGAEDVASAHRLLMEKATEIEPHGVYFCTADDTGALEPSLELVERFRPDLLPLVRELPGHASFHSCKRLKQAAGWSPRTSWREYL